tara:strand:+ start:14576 stop:15208 length:633 start_codon:yes stop_codon:yes gene_type:complete
MTELKKKNFSDLPAFASDIRKLLKGPKLLPPVESWRPERVGDIEILITSSGEWLYQGSKMERLSVVQLLATILRKDGDEYYLVSPAEKLKLEVEDVPFLVVMMDVEGVGAEQSLHFSTQVGDCFTLSPEHALRVSYNEKGEPSPYVHVRAGLDARLSRSVYYELADKLIELDDSVAEEQLIKPVNQEQKGFCKSDLPTMGVWSAGKFFIF